MKKRKAWLCAAAALIFALCLSSCGKADSVTEISLGEDLPVWMLDGEHTAERIPKNAGEGLIGIYTDKSGLADVYVYSFPKEEGLSLEEFGQKLATERNIFCNMLTDRDVPAAVLNYYESVGEEHSVVQAYIYESAGNFLEVCTVFKTELLPFGSGDLSIRMIREYAGEEKTGSPLAFDREYLTENDRLPTLRIREFSKDEFPTEILEPDLADAVSEEEYSALAEGGWEAEEIISLYGESYDLLRGDVMFRNDLNLAFIGYIDEGIFKTRAFIDDGSDYVLLSAEAEASKFQHLTNALIDAIEKNP